MSDSDTHRRQRRARTAATSFPCGIRSPPTSARLGPDMPAPSCGSRVCRGPASRTLAMALERRLFDLDWQVYTLDGDNVRRGLERGSGLLAARPRGEHPAHRRSRRALRRRRRGLHHRVHLALSRGPGAGARGGWRPALLRGVRAAPRLATCERRDPKGHYRKARAGELKDFTGVGAPYEEPEHPGIVIDTETQDVATCVEQLLAFVLANCRA